MVAGRGQYFFGLSSTATKQSSFPSSPCFACLFLLRGFIFSLFFHPSSSFAFSVPWMAINAALLGKIGSSRDNQGALAVAAQQRSPKYRASLKELSQFAWTGGWIMSFYMWPLFILLVIYRDRLIHGPQVWWSLLLLLLTTSASTCLKGCNILVTTYKPERGAQNTNMLIFTFWRVDLRGQ